jgi:subtilisin family serine protease
MDEDRARSHAAMADAGVQGGAVQYTGSYLVLLDDEDPDSGMSALHDSAGISTGVHLAGSDADSAAEALAAEGSVVLDEIGVAVVQADPDQQQAFTTAAAAAPGVLATERERIVFICDVSADYLRGYRDAVNALVDSALGGSEGIDAAGIASAAADEARYTWGLQAVLASESCYTGKGVRVAVLDTGVDTKHPDLVARLAGTKSFIDGETVQDAHGHGTHCIGTACGPSSPQALPRYGVAPDSEIYAGKVLSDGGSGADGGILAGINWAITSGCKVVSMSLGAGTRVGDRHSQVYENVARRALQRGSLIIAAAGNESNRPGHIAPVGHPANCPSILAVAALDPSLQVARFSCAGLNPDGGQVDIAAPGVDVLSSWPVPVNYRRINGTSMATPHVSGIAALLAEANPKASAAEIKDLLLSGARRLPLPARDVGVGLAQSP